MRISISSSISNWHDKLVQRTGWFPYVWWKHLYQPVTFFGLYRPEDLLKFLLHRGPKQVVWCGSDILGIGRHFRWIKKVKARHICENEVERGVLRLMLQQEVEYQPLFLSNPHAYKLSYHQSRRPSVFIHINKNAERESGLGVVERCAKAVPEVRFFIYGRVCPRKSPPNCIYRGYIPEDEFNEEIKNHQASLRCHVFDGSSEVTMKAALMGLHAISYIRYPHIDTYNNEAELIALLKKLPKRKTANTQARAYYLEQFKNPIWN